MIHHDAFFYEKAHILVYGDLILDRYWYGQVDRISPEAPVPIVAVDQTEARLGGAANVALNLVTLGAHVTLMGMVGQDDAGKTLRALLHEKNIPFDVDEIEGGVTVTKLRVWGHHQQLIRLDFEQQKSPEIHHLLSAAYIQRYREALHKVDVVIFSDYAKGACDSIQQLIEEARKQNKWILVDPKSVDFSCYAGASMITPNLKEFEAVVGACADDIVIEKKARCLMEQNHLNAILLTRGKQGLSFIPREADMFYLPASAREVYDVTGAGDTLIAVMAASLAIGNDIRLSARFANTAAGIVIGKLGTATLTVEELQRDILSLEHKQDEHHGIVTQKTLLSLVSDAREQGETIVMTNGCFDLLHEGHVHYLKKAKALGDRLIVAVNDDASLSSLKGEDRPFYALQARMRMLSALRAVDWVVSFSEETPARLIAEVLPDILVKGGDYELQTIAGAKVVSRHGGKVLTIPLLPGISTSHLIQKIKGKSI